jgi:hypothetical protein
LRKANLSLAGCLALLLAAGCDSGQDANAAGSAKGTIRIKASGHRGYDYPAFEVMTLPKTRRLVQPDSGETLLEKVAPGIYEVYVVGVDCAGKTTVQVNGNDTAVAELNCVYAIDVGPFIDFSPPRTDTLKAGDALDLLLTLRNAADLDSGVIAEISDSHGKVLAQQPFDAQGNAGIHLAGLTAGNHSIVLHAIYPNGLLFMWGLSFQVSP